MHVMSLEVLWVYLTSPDASPLSDATTCTLPSAEETQAILDTHADGHDLIREAQSCINNHLPASSRPTKILHAILNHAPSDHGRKYSRVTIINCCFGEQSWDARVHRLTRLASE
ncbi:hypothetical protein QCA50_016103 [Cerrena zonata]|uniref:Uncharacterized protein n=1 Tax=Cerrena zonata TaxID=2478898 RepID=A0AAW0FP97_9APHY